MSRSGWADAEPTSARVTSRAVLVVAMAMAVVGFNTTAISVATRGIADDLGPSISMLGWIIAAYMLTAASFSIAGARLGDSVGRARTFVIGIVVFIGGSLLSALSSGTWLLIAGRAVQGVGAALILPASIELIAAFSSTEAIRSGFRKRNVTFASAFAAGPLLGSLLTDDISWRTIFWLDIAVLSVALLLALPLIPIATRLPHRPTRDLRGALLLASLIFLVMLVAFEQRKWGSTSPTTVLVVVAIVVLAVAFVIVERRTPHPIVHGSVLRNRVLIGANVATLAASIGLLGLLYFFNVYAQSAATFDSSAFAAALALIPFTLTLLLFAHLSGYLARRFDYRVPVMLGLAVSVVGFWLLSRVSPGTSKEQLILPLSLCGIGAGIANSGLTGPAVLDVPRDRLDEAAGLVSLSRYVGAAFAVALGTSAYLSVALGPIPAAMAASGASPEQMMVGGSAYQRAAAALDASLRAPFEAAIRDDSVLGFASTMRITAVVLALLTVLSAWLLHPRGTRRAGVAAQARQSWSGVRSRGPVKGTGSGRPLRAADAYAAATMSRTSRPKRAPISGARPAAKSSVNAASCRV